MKHAFVVLSTVARLCATLSLPVGNLPTRLAVRGQRNHNETPTLGRIGRLSQLLHVDQGPRYSRHFLASIFSCVSHMLYQLGRRWCHRFLIRRTSSGLSVAHRPVASYTESRADSSTLPITQSSPQMSQAFVPEKMRLKAEECRLVPVPSGHLAQTIRPLHRRVNSDEGRHDRSWRPWWCWRARGLRGTDGGDLTPEAIEGRARRWSARR